MESVVSSTPVTSSVVSKVFAYDGNNVTFARKDGVTMVNATQMAKNFGKRPNDWFNLPSTKSFLGVLSDTRKSCNAEFQAVRVVKGGINGGGATWMHEDVALEFARWLSPAFAIWCNDRIKELLTTGSTSIQKNLPQNYVEALRELANQVERNEQLALENKQKEQKIVEQKPKVAFADALLSSPDSILINELAKILCQNGYKTGEVRLFEQLRKEGYLCKVGSDYNLPTQKYLEMGLFEVVKGTRSAKDGVLHQTRTTKVTPKGVQYFVNKFVKKEPDLFGDMKELQ